MATQAMGGNEVYMVFGAAGGIGQELCKQLAKCPEVGTLVLLDHNEDKLKSVCSALHGKNCDVCVVDASDPQSVDSAFKKTCEKYHGKPLAGVVNLIGDYVHKPLMQTTPEDFMHIMKDNLVTCFNVLKGAVCCMERQGSGSIVLVSSAAAEHGIKNHEAWSAAKAGVEGLVKSAAASFASKGIRINCVAPGLTKTGETTAVHQHADLHKRTCAMYPMKRIAEPTEIACAIEFLVSKKASFITGQCLAVDGGMTTLSCVTEPGTTA